MNWIGNLLTYYSHKNMNNRFLKSKQNTYLCIGAHEEDPDLQISKIRKCEEYKYLDRAGQGRKCIGMLNSLFWSGKIRLTTKMTIYAVESILTYRAECWQLSIKNRKKNLLKWIFSEELAEYFVWNTYIIRKQDK